MLMRKGRKNNPELRKTRQILINHLRAVECVTKAKDYTPEAKERTICMQFGFIMGYYSGKGFSDYKLCLCYEYINSCLDKVKQERKGK